jgi:hypothetical protein
MAFGVPTFERNGLARPAQDARDGMIDPGMALQAPRV